jgi:hypothetical protein
MRNNITTNDIKYDLLKIIEPYDGMLETGKPRPVRHLFVQYLRDLQKDRFIYDFGVNTTDRNAAITFDVNIQMAPGRSPKKLKIHVGTFQKPWCNAQ